MDADEGLCLLALPSRNDFVPNILLGRNSRSNMAAPKAKTLQERFGFLDADLKKPEHDAMIQWIDANIEDILMLVFSLPTRPKDVITTWEIVVRQTEDGGMMIGFVDLSARRGDWRVLFEAKTTIDSLGELFRQVRMYQEGYIGREPVWRMPIVIVCPVDTRADIIRQQRLHFLKYDPAQAFSLGGV